MGSSSHPGGTFKIPPSRDWEAWYLLIFLKPHKGSVSGYVSCSTKRVPSCSWAHSQTIFPRRLCSSLCSWDWVLTDGMCAESHFCHFWAKSFRKWICTLLALFVPLLIVCWWRGGLGGRGNYIVKQNTIQRRLSVDKSHPPARKSLGEQEISFY